MRCTAEQLEQIKKENGVDVLWSWSRVNSWSTSKYEWFLHYFQGLKGERLDCIYGKEGSYSHDILEKFYNGLISYEDMVSEFELSWNTTRDILNLKFNRNDAEKDESTAKKYYENLRLFFSNHDVIKYDLVTEDFTTVKIGKNVLQGYIDAHYTDENGVLHIVDWKTSSIYTGKNLESKSGQLVCYALSFMQKGIPMKNIKIGFNFLKYCTITHALTSKDGVKTTNVERRLLGEKLQSPCKTWLKKLGYQDELDDYLKKVLDTGDIKCLPADVQEKISISDCYVDVPLTKELIQYWQNYIEKTINEIEEKTMLYEIYGDDSIFYDTEEEVAEQSFYYATLSEYSPNQNVCYAKYLDSLENKQGVDLLG